MGNAFVCFEQSEVFCCPLMIFFLQRETTAAYFPDFIDGNEGVGVDGADQLLKLKKFTW